MPWLVIAVLVGINALYVAAEFAAVAVQRSRVAQMAREGHRRAAGLLEVVDDRAALDRYIAACQIGITLSSLIVGAYGQATIAPGLGTLLESALGISERAAESAATITVLIVLTAIQVVLGELVPKSLALQFTERFALLTYLPTRFSRSLYRPFIALLNGSAMLLLKPFGVEPGGPQHVHSPREIELLLAESERAGELTPELHQRIERALRISNRSVRQLMVPRSEIVAIEASTPPDEVIRRVLDSPYSSLPVYRETLDDIVGIVRTKDLVALYALALEWPRIEDAVRRIPFVPETISADRLVRFLREQRVTKAIVVDEFGGVSGIVSIEDVLGALFGAIADELKEPEARPEVLPDGTVKLLGSVSLDEAERLMGVRWQGEAATIGGRIVEVLGRLPHEGEELDVDGVHVRVLEMTPSAVRTVAVSPVEPRAAAAGGDP